MTHPTQPYAGETPEETIKWLRSKYPKGLTTKSSRAYAVELYKSKPNRNEDPAGEQDWYNSLSEFQKKILEDAKRQKAKKKDDKEFREFKKRYSLSDDEARKCWATRGKPALPGESQSEWDRIRNRLQKRKKAPHPRKNTDLSQMTDEDKAAHRREQNRKAKQRSRAKSAMSAQ